jgi:hypothetical protein
MLPLRMEQVSQEKKNVTADAVKLAWEQAKEKVEVWAKSAAQMENVHLTRDEERAEQAPLMAERHGNDENDSCSIAVAASFMFIISLVAMSVLAVIFSWIDLANYKVAPTALISYLLVIRNTILLLYVVLVLLVECLIYGDNGPLTYINGPLTYIHRIFVIPIFIYSLIITVVLQSWYKENGREWLFIATIINSSLVLTMYLYLIIRPVYVRIDYYNRAQSSKIKALAQTKMANMANIVDAAVDVTRGWVATKNSNLQKHLTANDTSQVDLKMILAISSKTEAVIQNCKKAQETCQAAVKSQDSSIASKQATEILQAIATAEGYLLEVEQMLPQPLYHPDIQMK